MSYDIRLKEPVTKETILFKQKHHVTGGMYCIGGTQEAWLNVTWNYAPIFRRVIHYKKGIRAIYGMTGAESIPILKSAIDSLKNDETNNYFDPTEGNARKALCGLLAFAQMRPDGIWDGD